MFCFLLRFVVRTREKSSHVPKIKHEGFPPVLTDGKYKLSQKCLLNQSNPLPQPPRESVLKGSLRILWRNLKIWNPSTTGLLFFLEQFSFQFFLKIYTAFTSNIKFQQLKVNAENSKNSFLISLTESPKNYVLLMYI